MSKSTKPDDKRTRRSDPPAPKPSKQPNAQAHRKIDTRNGETLCTEEMAAEFEKWATNGLFTTQICAIVNISTVTFYDWLKRGAKGQEPYASFANRIKRAEALAEGNSVGSIRAAGKKNWQANGWFLERKYPDRWARREHTTIAGDPSSPLAVSVASRQQRMDLKRLTPAEFAELKRLREKAMVPADEQAQRKGEADADSTEG